LINEKISKHIGKKYRKLILTVLIALLAIVFLFPMILTVSNSFMSEGEINENYKPITNTSTEENSVDNERNFVNLKLVPDEVVIKQYYSVLLQKPKFLLMFWNSMALVIPIILGQVLVSSMAAYAFAKINFRYREQLFFIYIITMLMPFQVTLVPNYIVADRMGILGSYLSIIFPGIFGTFGVFLLRQFMIYIPDEYAEAARVDGAGHFSIFSKIILPLSKTGLAALAILVFIDNWNMVEQPIIFLQDKTKQPLSIFLTSINNEETGIAFAASTLYMLPMLLVFLYGENYLIEGIQLSGIKG
jgi:multiple sugar transport system permease protein